MSMFSIQILFPPERLLITSFLWIGTDKTFFLTEQTNGKDTKGGWVLRLEIEVRLEINSSLLKIILEIEHRLLRSQRK